MATLRWMVPLLAAGATVVGVMGAAGAGAAGAAPTKAAAGAEAPHVAFFGFATDNSFAQATWKGVEEAAAKEHGTAYFFNGAFSATTQVSQMETATTSGKYNVFVVQANDGSSVVPEVKAAIAKGIVVVAEFTQVGSTYATIAPQVKGEISVVEDTVLNGKDLGELADTACRSLSRCNVVYLEGFTTLPLTVARSNEVVKVLKSTSKVHLLEETKGGYTASTGETAAEDVLTAHPTVNVIIGSSQACEGVTVVLKDRGLVGKVTIIGNGGSTQAVTYVRKGTWYATFGIPEVTDGYDATLYGIEKLHGGHPPTATNSATLGPNHGVWTQSVVKSDNIKGDYSDG